MPYLFIMLKIRGHLIPWTHMNILTVVPLQSPPPIPPPTHKELMGQKTRRLTYAYSLTEAGPLAKTAPPPPLIPTFWTSCPPWCWPGRIGLAVDMTQYTHFTTMLARSKRFRCKHNTNAHISQQCWPGRIGLAINMIQIHKFHCNAGLNGLAHFALLIYALLSVIFLPCVRCQGNYT